jgi:hypothetical protein
MSFTVQLRHTPKYADMLLDRILDWTYSVWDQRLHLLIVPVRGCLRGILSS